MKKLFLALTIGLTAMACRDKEKDYPACGCEARNDRYEEYTRNEKNQEILYYVKDNIYAIRKDYPIMIIDGTICNPESIPNEIKNQMKQGKQFYINSFKGYIKCYDKGHPTDRVLYYITLTNIEIGEEVKTENKLKF